ncbi:MAG: hypothetical protein ACLQBB_01635 [Solirubrobacteraceae bacterium]
MAPAETSTTALPAHVPSPPSERRAWALACAIAALGLTVLVAALSGMVGGAREAAPPPVPVRAQTPLPAAASTLASGEGAGSPIVARPTTAQQRADARRFTAWTRVHISRRWMAGFYPIYTTAQRAFGVNWLLLASIHMQESAFSTAPGVYQGLNFAHCCGGPMQFNVTNGGGRASRSTWDLVSNSYVYGRRPAVYDHMTATHPSIYDDFDAIMAAAHLLSADGAGFPLDGSAWAAAYDYYGHDATGVLYADQVLARAIGWSQHGFCINCGVEPRMVRAVEDAYGAPVMASLAGQAAPASAAPPRRRAVTRPG